MTLDLFNLPPTTSANVQVFTGPVSTVTNVQWFTWTKPRGVSMIEFIGIGSGSGGGGAFSNIAGSTRGGSGGGASGGMARVLIPAIFIPDVVYLQIGAGGVGGIPTATNVVPALANDGTAGVITYVSVAPNTAAGNVILRSSNAAPTRGQCGSGTAAGSNGAGGTIATIANMPIAALGVYFMIAGQDGAIGAPETGANGFSVALPTTGIRAGGGAGGAGVTATDFAGGIITPIASTYLGQQCAAAPAAGAGGDGSGGPMIWQPLFGFGGCGGSSSNTGTGGNGGNGGYGAGGGGAGSGVTGGYGGAGGSGLIAITCW